MSGAGQVRHSMRPLSVFAFCGEAIAAERGEYMRSAKERCLPACKECQRARDKAEAMLGNKQRKARRQ